jgi:DMSO/TMAO reductase YedYZ molybdopterin-dependent catalytic subunit
MVEAVKDQDKDGAVLAEVRELAELLQYQDGSVVSRMLTGEVAVGWAALLMLVGGILFEIVTGLMNIQYDYAFGFSFYTAHYIGAWVFLAGFVALMLTAAWTVHRKNGFFIVKEGWEYNLVLAVSAVAVATLGAGRFSLDWLIFGHNWLDGWAGLLISAGLGLAGGIGQLVIFYRPPQPAEAN